MMKLLQWKLGTSPDTCRYKITVSFHDSLNCQRLLMKQGDLVIVRLDGELKFGRYAGKQKISFAKYFMYDS